MILKNCPFCQEDGNILLVEGVGCNFAKSQAFECFNCGFRVLGSDQEDGEEIAVKIWNEIVEALA